MEKKGTIYKIENLMNGKVYVGQTRVGFEKRLNEHLYALKKNTHNNDYLQRAWNKYSEENFSFSIIASCEIKELDRLETEWISYYKKNNLSYNLESGGNKNKRHSDYSLKKLSVASKRNWNNPEYSEKLRKIFAKIHGGKNNVRAKKVICIDTNEVFETMTAASERYSIPVIGIHRVCSGQRITAGKLQFAYYEEGKKYKLKPIPDRTKGNHHAARKIICINNNMVFDSVVRASEYFGINYHSIHQILLGKNNAALGLDGKWYQFSYYENGLTYSLKEIKNIKKPKKVKCINTGEIFNSTREAAEKMKVNQSKVSLCCNGKRNSTGKLPDGTKLKWEFC